MTKIMNVWEMWQVVVLEISCFLRARKMRTKTLVREGGLTRRYINKIIDIARWCCK
jgi:hypothetical protein